MNRVYISLIHNEGEKPIVYELDEVTLFQIEQEMHLIEPDNPSSPPFATRELTGIVTVTVKGRLIPKS